LLQVKAALALTNIISGDNERPAPARLGGGRDARVASPEINQTESDARVASKIASFKNGDRLFYEFC
jgi:hypothetical protein